MAPYSMDLRQRVARAWDAGMDAETVAGKYDVSRAWVHRLIQRRRETGSLRSRKQQKFRHRVLSSREEERLASLITAHPDATLTELRAALPTTVPQHAVAHDRPLGIYAQQERYTPTNSDDLMSRPRGGSGGPGSHCGTSASTSSWMNVG